VTLLRAVAETSLSRAYKVLVSGLQADANESGTHWDAPKE
jgi:hypothetical protein